MSIESLDVSRIYSVADQLPPETSLLRNRPFRSLHHTISHAGLVSSGQLAASGRDLTGASRRTLPGQAAQIWHVRAGSAAPAD